ncbi:MAG TPA: 3-methyl-2-oxobutanoate hydroxymethyltransferase [Bryobacteraceae bacterium]|jgi:3-methyl-2-oxobutanoate hydroxymethyltransferase|nr:3-methyl-2-oxobutanoate hydroxymethyltransferase [Bryobacteraceae bacterium]
MQPSAKKVRIHDLARWKLESRKITMLTAYDATMAALLDRAGIDVLLVGDSLGMVVLGHETTIPVTLEAVIHHSAAVARGSRRALVVADMPFLTYQLNMEQALRNAGRLLQEGGAHAVKIEGGRGVVEVAARLVEVGIPVMGHLGMTPQSVHQLGGFGPVGRNEFEAEQIVDDARALQQAGAFAVVLESIPSELAARVTAELALPTIGIGAGPDCDGQVLVSYDAFGLFDRFVPRFVKRYANLGEMMVQGAQKYIRDVQDGAFPGEEHTTRSQAAIKGRG